MSPGGRSPDRFLRIELIEYMFDALPLHHPIGIIDPSA
jgi:hypothetical protein